MSIGIVWQRIFPWCVALGLGCVGSQAFAAANPLIDYVARPDSHYRYFARISDTQGLDPQDEVPFAELTMISQVWRGITWKHQLFVVKPPEADAGITHALLFIDGGSWHGAMDGPVTGAERKRLYRRLQIYARLAKEAGTIIAVLKQVPFQPIFDGMKEDRAIAYTFSKYLQTEDPEWPLLLPMVKSAVRAMDTVQDFAKRAWGIKIRTFTVTGASKRGWTTWLAGAIDPRVTAIAPMVFDMLSMERQVVHQRASWGKVSGQISDYSKRGVLNGLGTDAGRRLLRIVDPFAYRKLLDEPKLIIVGTNDHYWPIDALNLYWPELPGPKYILYLPNQGHGIRDHKRIVGSIRALNLHSAYGTALPKLTWNLERQGDRVVLSAHSSGMHVRRSRAWVAFSETRDFRSARWQKRNPHRRNGIYQYSMQAPTDRCAALFMEFEYGTRFGKDISSFFSTNVRIVGPPRCHVAS